MFKKILLPTDFSGMSWSAINYALKLFRDDSCTFYLLNSTLVKVTTMTSFTEKLSRTLHDTAMRELDEWVNRIKAEELSKPHKFERIVSQYHLDDAVEWAVEKFDLELVIMATKGASGAKGALFGSNAVRVIREVGNCPVLIIPEHYEFKKPGQIAFPTDFERAFKSDELTPLKVFARMFDANIRVMHIVEEKELNEEQKKNKEALTTLMEPCSLRFHWVPDYDKKSKEIEVFIETSYVDMLAMVRYKHGILEAIFNEPVIKKISFRPTVPFLVIPG